MAKKFSAPGVIVSELDISEVVAPTGTSVGAAVGAAKKGMVNARTLLTTNKKLIETFGTPDPDWLSTDLTKGNDAALYAGLEFLQESGAMWFTRVADGTEDYANLMFTDSAMELTSAVNASSTTTRIAAGDEAFEKTQILDIDDAGDTGQLVVAAIGPGKYGNNVGIRVITSASYESSDEAAVSSTSAYVGATSGDFDWGYLYDEPDSGTGAVVTSGNPTWKKVFKVEVYERATETSDFPSVASETFYGTIGNVLGPNGANLNIEKAINGVSKFIYVEDKMTAGSVPVYSSAANYSNTEPIDLKNGADSTVYGPDLANTKAILPADITNGWSYYADKEKVNPNILIGSYWGAASLTGATAAIKKPVTLAGTRKDCIATVQISGPSTTDATDIVNESNTQSFAAPSYGAKYGAWSLVYDSFNDRNVYVPNSMWGAVLMARTDKVANTWNAPAGIRRGKLAVLGQNVKFNQSEIGLLYDANVNPVKFMNGNGNVMWGQRTAQKTVTALREIAVRRLMLLLEGTIEPFLMPFVFEQNSESNRIRIGSLIDSYLKTVQAGNGIVNYKVVVDDTNNSANDIDNGVLNVDIYIQPTRTIEFINLQFIITGSGVNLAELTV